MTRGHIFTAKVWIITGSLLIISVCALLLSGAPPFFEIQRYQHGLPVLGHPDEIVTEYRSFFLNGKTYVDGKTSNGFISDGPCYVYFQRSDGTKRIFCHRVHTRYDRLARTGRIEFQ
jgi:hypothetical protein